IVVDVRGGSQHAAVASSGGNGPGVHQSHSGDLAVAGLGALPVGKVPGGMADGEGVIGGGVACAEAGAAEGGLHDAAGLHEGGRRAVFGDGQGDGGGGGIHAHVKVSVADAAALKDGGGLNDVLIHTAGAAYNH